jgi:hypothetical protein
VTQRGNSPDPLYAEGGASPGPPPAPGGPATAAGGKGPRFRAAWITVGVLALVSALSVACLVFLAQPKDTTTSSATSANRPSASTPSDGPSSWSPGLSDGARIAMESLAVGDCVNAEKAEDMSDLTVVGCTAAHLGEVIGVYEVAGETFPGEEAVTREAERRCDALTPDNLAGREDLVLYYLYPQDSSWKEGHREVQCLVISEGGPLTRRIADL